MPSFVRFTVIGALVLVLCALMVGSSTAAAAGRCGDPAQRPWCNTRLSPDERAQLLLGALTPAERIGLLGGDDVGGVAGGEHKHTGTRTASRAWGFRRSTTRMVPWVRGRGW